MLLVSQAYCAKTISADVLKKLISTCPHGRGEKGFLEKEAKLAEEGNQEKQAAELIGQ